MNLRRWIQGQSTTAPEPSAGSRPGVDLFLLHERTSALGRAIARIAERRAPVRVLHDAADLMEELEASRGRGREVVLIVCDSERARMTSSVPVAWFAQITTLASSFVYVDARVVRVFRNGALLLDRPLGEHPDVAVTELLERVLRRVVDGVSNSSGLAPRDTRRSSARRSQPTDLCQGPQLGLAGRVA